MKCSKCGSEDFIWYNDEETEKNWERILNSLKLPNELDIGKRTKTIDNNYEGLIIKHYINMDDCAGSYGKQCYELLQDNGEVLSISKEYCKIIKNNLAVEAAAKQKREKILKYHQRMQGR